MEKILYKYIDALIAAITGVALAYFVSSVIEYNLPQDFHMNSADIFVHKKIIKSVDMDKVILSADILNADTGIKVIRSGKKAKIVSNLKGYRLVGFVSGKNPMAMFKKPAKPVAIVTQNNGLNGVWLLDKIEKNGVYLKNKKTKELRKFEFPNTIQKLSMFVKNQHLNNIIKTSSSSGIEKVVVNRSVLKKIGNINVLFKKINIVPVFKNGVALGYRINYMRQNSILGKIGLRVGDTIVSINGEPTTNPNRIMKIYSQMRNMTAVNLNILRNGNKKTIFVEIK